MFDGDGAETLELQAYKVAQNATMYKGSHPCPSCGMIIDPVQYLYQGMCNQCKNDRSAQRVKGKMA